jgi:hypothetical protein
MCTAAQNRPGLGPAAPGIAQPKQMGPGYTLLDTREYRRNRRASCAAMTCEPSSISVGGRKGLFPDVRCASVDGHGISAPMALNPVVTRPARHGCPYVAARILLPGVSTLSFPSIYRPNTCEPQPAVGYRFIYLYVAMTRRCNIRR